MMRKIFQVIITMISALAGWTGLAIYFFYKKNLPTFSFTLWHAVLVVFFFCLLSLVYYKFFDSYSLTTTIIILLATVLIADIIAFFLNPEYLSNFSSLDFIISYGLMIATIAVTHFIYHKSWRKNNT